MDNPTLIVLRIRVSLACLSSEFLKIKRLFYTHACFSSSYFKLQVSPQALLVGGKWTFPVPFFTSLSTVNVSIVEKFNASS